jgi:hypothetical protein
MFRDRLRLNENITNNCLTRCNEMFEAREIMFGVFYRVSSLRSAFLRELEVGDCSRPEREIH